MISGECNENDNAWLALLPVFTGVIIGMLLALGMVYSIEMDTSDAQGAGVPLIIVGIFWEIALGIIVLYFSTVHSKTIDPYEPFNDSDDDIMMETRNEYEDTESDESDEEPLPQDPEEAKKVQKERKKKMWDKRKKKLSRNIEKAMASKEVRRAEKGCKHFLVELSKLIPSIIGSFMFMLGIAMASGMKTTGNDTAGSSLLAVAFCLILLLILIKILNRKAEKIRNQLGWL